MNVRFLFLFFPKLSLIPQINSLENFCSKQELDEYRLHNCVEIALQTGPQVLPGACERLLVSMSARLHDGAVGEYRPEGLTQCTAFVNMNELI